MINLFEIYEGRFFVNLIFSVLLLCFSFFNVSGVSAADIGSAAGIEMSISEEEKVAGELFWSHVEKMDFEEALKSEQSMRQNYSKFMQAEIFFDAAELIERAKGINDKVLREFLLLEHRRNDLRLSFFDTSITEETIAFDIDNIVKELKRLNKLKDLGFLKVEVMYALGLAYTSAGTYDLNRFRDAIKIFYKILEKYPDSELVDDAKFGIIMAQVEREYALGRVVASTDSRISVLKKFIKENPGSNKIIEARYNLATDYYFNRNYDAVIKEYKKIVDGNTINNFLLIEVLKDLIEICGGKESYDCNHKKYIKIMEGRYPDTEFAKWAKGKL